MKTDFVSVLGWATVGLACLRPATAQQPRLRPPNVILLMTDDQGYGEIGAHGKQHGAYYTRVRFHPSRQNQPAK